MLSIHELQLTEVSELRWNGASELIREKDPETATMKYGN